MPVIINEFEIIPDPPPDQPQLPAPAAEGEPRPVVPDPEDIIRIQRLYRDRRRRLRAD